MCATAQARTAIKVGATAGLRLLPGGKADDILAAVRAHLTKDYPFRMDQVSIIDGGRRIVSWKRGQTWTRPLEEPF